MLAVLGVVGVLREVWRGIWVAGGETCLKRTGEELGNVGESS